MVAYLASPFWLACAHVTTRLDELEAQWRKVATAHEGEGVFKVRYNPTECDVPPNEVQIDGRWYRVKLLPDRPVGVAAALNARLARQLAKGDVLSVSWVRGRLSGEVREAENLSLYLEMEVLQECSPTACKKSKK